LSCRKEVLFIKALMSSVLLVQEVIKAKHESIYKASLVIFPLDKPAVIQRNTYGKLKEILTNQSIGFGSSFPYFHTDMHSVGGAFERKAGAGRNSIIIQIGIAQMDII